MNKIINKTMVSILTTFLLLVSVFGCSASEGGNQSPSSSVIDAGEKKDEKDTVSEKENDNPTVNDTEDNTQQEDDMFVSGLSDEQWNSISMLNYLTVIAQEVNSSKNGRLYLESVYSSLINNTYPNAVDITTEAHLEDLLDTLENYRMIEEKRERLQYVYEQKQLKRLSQIQCQS